MARKPTRTTPKVLAKQPEFGETVTELRILTKD